MKRHISHSFSWLTGLLVAAFVMAVCSCGNHKGHPLSPKEQREQQQAAERAAFKVAVTPTMDCLPVYLLKDSLLYDTAKVDIRLRTFTSQMDVDTALVGGSVQVGVSDLVRVAFLEHRGTRLRTLTTTAAYWQLYAAKDQKLTLLSQLQDKLIGMTRHSVTDMLTTEAVKKGKLKRRAFPTQINDVSLRWKMMQNSELEVAWLPEPMATQARLGGCHLLVDNSNDMSRMGVMAYRENALDDLAKREQQFNDFLFAYQRACDSINKHGIAHYAPLIEKYMHLDVKTAKALPKIHYEGIVAPRPADIHRAKSFL